VAQPTISGKPNCPSIRQYAVLLSICVLIAVCIIFVLDLFKVSTGKLLKNICSGNIDVYVNSMQSGL